MSVAAFSSDPDAFRIEPLRPESNFDAFVQHDENTHLLHIIIRGAKCGGCLSKIERAVHALTGVSQARLNLSNGSMRIRWSGNLKADDIVNEISGLGYDVAPVTAKTNGNSSSEEKSLLIAMGVAGFAAANIMLLSVAVWAGQGEMGDTTRRMLHALSGFIALPVLIFSGRHFFKSAFKVLRRGHANMDVPISLALLLAFGVSIAETISGGAHAYFDAAIMLLFFLLIGRFLEARLKRQAYSAASALAAMRNKPVTVLNSSGVTSCILAEEVRVGDTIVVAPGERAMVDMLITNGESDIDESLLTGESLPRCYRAGNILRGGAVNLTAPLIGNALSAADDSLLGAIAEMLEAGEQRRSTYTKLADRAVSIYIPFVHTTAALAGLAWLLLGASMSDALMISVTTLIITCPCALALAAPVAQIVAAGRLFQHGIYLRSGDALERIAEIDHIAFDKTGTLTLGEPKLKRIILDGAPISLDTFESRAVIEDAATLARASYHPLSRTIAKIAGAGTIKSNIYEKPGKGLKATIEGNDWRLGSANWAGQKERSSVTGPVLYFQKSRSPLAIFEFEDQPLGSADKALNELRLLGVSAEIISGDRSASVKLLADKLGVKSWFAQHSPEDKVNRLEKLRSEGRKVLMVGDGLNDTGALSLAHASLTPGTAMDVSQSASDAIYCGSLRSVPETIRVARQTRSVMRQNFALAAGYNLVAVPIAVAGLVTPLIAAIAMSASSILVTLNALKLNIGK